jgi:hypothetical protein
MRNLRGRRTTVTIHFIPGPTVEIARTSDGTRWCFGCRKHLPHDLVLLDYRDDDTYHYFGPATVTKCSRCGKDRTRFPGSDQI